jgi:hypothetical protein
LTPRTNYFEIHGYTPIKEALPRLKNHRKKGLFDWLMVYVIDELPGFTRFGELTIAAHPALVGNEDPRIDTS